MRDFHFEEGIAFHDVFLLFFSKIRLIYKQNVKKINLFPVRGSNFKLREHLEYQKDFRKDFGKEIFVLFRTFSRSALKSGRILGESQMTKMGKFDQKRQNFLGGGGEIWVFTVIRI